MDFCWILKFVGLCAVTAKNEEGSLIVPYQENDILSADIWLYNIPSGYDYCEITKTAVGQTKNQGALIQNSTFQDNFPSQWLSLKLNELKKSDHQSVLEIMLVNWGLKKYILLQIIKLKHSKKSKKPCINEKCAINIDCENHIITWGKPRALNPESSPVDSPKINHYAAADINLKNDDKLHINDRFKNLPNIREEERKAYEVKNVETPYVSITPNFNPAYFGVNSIKAFECSGSTPLKSRTLMWYIEGLSSNEFNIAVNQSYDWMTNKNVLTLHLNESYHMKRIYCAQVYEWNKLNKVSWNYGEIVRSHNITLKINQGEESEQNEFKNGALSKGSSMPTIWSTNSTVLVILVASLVTAVMLIVLGVWMARRRRNDQLIKNQDDTSECNYATAQVTYAILDLPSDSNKRLPNKEATPYVEIVGFYKPNPTTKSI